MVAHALDVVGVAVLQGLGDGILQAGHLRLAGPVPGRQIGLGIQGVALEAIGHVQPVNAAHEFTPAQDLPDKSFHCRQWRVTVAVGRLGGVHHFARVQQF